MPFSRAAEAFLAERTPPVSPSVARDYRVALKTRGAAFAGRGLTPETAEAIVAQQRNMAWNRDDLGVVS